MEKIFSEKNRAYAYRVILAVGVLLGGYGLLTDDQIVMWTGLVAALLQIMPTANTSTKTPVVAPSQTGLAVEPGQQGPIVSEVK